MKELRWEIKRTEKEWDWENLPQIKEELHHKMKNPKKIWEFFRFYGRILKKIGEWVEEGNRQQEEDGRGAGDLGFWKQLI